MMRPRLKAFALPCLAVLILAAITATAYAQLSATQSATSLAEYRNDHWHFSVAVPTEMHAQENPAGLDGSQEIQFSDASYKKQFIVTATPYSQFDVTLQRSGDASGSNDQPNHLEIVTVYRDDLFHVWFVKHGVLYTIVTMPDLETWLTETILPSWQFTD